MKSKMRQTKIMQEAIIESHGNRIKDLEDYKWNIQAVIFIIIFMITLVFISVVYTYYILPHRICTDEITTQKVEIKSIDPYHNNPYGVIKEYDYPNSKIVCESGVEKSAFNSDTYVGKVGQTCLITTTKKVCEIK